jgi:hypothetical protein
MANTSVTDLFFTANNETVKTLFICNVCFNLTVPFDVVCQAQA